MAQGDSLSHRHVTGGVLPVYTGWPTEMARSDHAAARMLQRPAPRLAPVTLPLHLLHALLTAVALAVPAAAIADDAREVLGPGDTVRVTVFQNAELSGDLRLSERGSIVMPLIGEVALAGQTPLEAGTTIAARYSKGRFLVNPQVSVSLLTVKSRQVSVLGRVARPGQYPLENPGMRLTDVLALAGGIAEGGDSRVVAMTTRDGVPKRIEVDVTAMVQRGDMAQNLEMQAGDTIFVPEAAMFYVSGEVQRAGGYRLAEDTTVRSAIAMGGGLTPRGTLRGLRIHRRLPDGSIKKLDARLTDKVEAGDVIEVREGFF